MFFSSGDSATPQGCAKVLRHSGINLRLLQGHPPPACWVYPDSSWWRDEHIISLVVKNLPLSLRNLDLLIKEASQPVSSVTITIPPERPTTISATNFKWCVSSKINSLEQSMVLPWKTKSKKKDGLRVWDLIFCKWPSKKWAFLPVFGVSHVSPIFSDAHPPSHSRQGTVVWRGWWQKPSRWGSAARSPPMAFWPKHGGPSAWFLSGFPWFL